MAASPHIPELPQYSHLPIHRFGLAAAPSPLPFDRCNHRFRAKFPAKPAA